MIELIILAIIPLWIFFVNVMWMKHNKEKVPKWAYPFAYAFAIIGYIYDILFNIVIGTIMFLALPDFKGSAYYAPPLTHRLRKILREANTTSKLDKYRFFLAMYICRYLVEPWDPNHCGLEGLGG